MIVVEDFQCEPVGDVDLEEAACAEALSVGLHALGNAGGLLGKRVVVTAVEPIGTLLVGAAKLAGARAMERIHEAFDIVRDRSSQMKVPLDFSN